MSIGKKIGIVANTSWSIYNFRLGLIKRLRKEGYLVYLIAPQDNYSALLVAEGFRYYPIHISRNGVNPLKDMYTFQQLHKIYKQNKLDFIFHYTIKPNIYGSLAAAFNGIPSIAITTGLGHLFLYRSILVRWFAVLLYRLALKYSSQVWFLNEEDKKIFIEKNIVGQEKTFLLPSEGVNMEHFQPQPYATNYSRKISFLFAGRLLWDKGVGLFAEAARIIRAKYPFTQFELLGFVDMLNPNTVSYEQIDDWQREGILRYLGETEDVRPYIAQSNCIVYPSFYGEGISRLLLESASMAKPIITTNNVGCREVVEHNANGFLCKPKNLSDLVDKIELFLSITEQEHRQMGFNGQKKVLEHFNEWSIIQYYITALSSFFNEKNESIKSKNLRRQKALV